MQRCLAVVGDVPELSGGRKKLSTLEERLEAMVASRLQNALARKKSEETTMLAGILSRVGRSKYVWCTSAPVITLNDVPCIKRL